MRADIEHTTNRFHIWRELAEPWISTMLTWGFDILLLCIQETLELPYGVAPLSEVNTFANAPKRLGERLEKSGGF